MSSSIPKHIAIIMDGNGRWAKAQNRPRAKGHEAGAKAVEKTIKHAQKIGVQFITLYAFSTENWTRPQDEINALMKLLGKVLDEYKKTSQSNGMRLLVSGRRDRLPKEILAKIDDVVNSTKDNKGLCVNLALNYGARQEITDAVNKLTAEGKTNITEADISAALYNPSVPDPDLIIRTSGEERLSNFLLWQAAYSEFYFTQTLWPDFDEAELDKAVTEYSTRQRRYGNI
ncbi:undecaprenyl diphosphate synthase [Elusimicrobium posterum]|uniref:isoprenyl transferase n=1 Tax=Elusimicrobium posterum TaxID=3116653 RepID=UPI003C75DBC8